MKKTGVYAFVNLKDGSRYIGQAQDIDKRRNDHLSMLRRGKHSNRRFQRAFSRDGEESFAFVVLCLCRKCDLNDAEQYYLNDMRGLYNFSPVAQANAAGKRDEEAKSRMSEARLRFFERCPDATKKHGELMRERFKDPEERKKAGAANVGRVHSEAERLRRSISVKAALSSDEYRAAAKQRSRKMWADEGYRSKHAESMKAAITPEVVEKRNEAIKQAKAERFADPEYRAAISAKLKAAWAKRKQAAKQEH